MSHELPRPALKPEEDEDNQDDCPEHDERRDDGVAVVQAIVTLLPGGAWREQEARHAVTHVGRTDALLRRDGDGRDGRTERHDDREDEKRPPRPRPARDKPALAVVESSWHRASSTPIAPMRQASRRDVPARAGGSRAGRAVAARLFTGAQFRETIFGGMSKSGRPPVVRREWFRHRYRARRNARRDLQVELRVRADTVAAPV
jgi:hypothetical protein